MGQNGAVVEKSCRFVTIPVGTVRTKYGRTFKTRFSCCTGRLVDEYNERNGNNDKVDIPIEV